MIFPYLLLFSVVSLCAIQTTFSLGDFRLRLERVLYNLKNKNWDIVSLSEFKNSIDNFQDSDQAIFLQEIKPLLESHEIEITHKLTIFSLYHLPSSFSFFEIFEPFFGPIKGNEYDIYLSTDWLNIALEFNSPDSPKSLYLDFVNFRRGLLGQLSTYFVNVVENSPYDRTINDIATKFAADPLKVLKMSLFESLPAALPSIVYFHLNPLALNVYTVYIYRTLRGFFFGRYAEPTARSSAISFLMLTSAKLESHEIILISPLFNDLVRRRLIWFLGGFYSGCLPPL